VWLHVLTPIQTATLIAGHGLLTQGYGCYNLRRMLERPENLAARAGNRARDSHRETLALYGLGVPFMVAGLWSGFRLYGKINDETFRKTVLVLLLLSGLSLIVPVAMQIPFERH
jgi:hypothetical protein